MAEEKRESLLDVSQFFRRWKKRRTICEGEKQGQACQILDVRDADRFDTDH